MLTYECTEGSGLCNFMCSFVDQLLFNILNNLWVVDGADRLFHLRLCYEILFLLWCGSCQRWSLVNRSIFPDFCTRPYTDSALPPHAPARPPCVSVAPAHCVAWRCRSQVNQRSRMHSTQRKDSSMNSKT